MPPRWALRPILLFLSITILLGVAFSQLPPHVLRAILIPWITRPPDPTPPAPSLLAPAGPVPDSGPIGLVEWRITGEQTYTLVGSGFLLQLSNGSVVGVTTAHSLPNLHQPAHGVTQLVLARNGQSEPLVIFDTLQGEPGQPRADLDLSTDWVLLHTSQTIETALILSPDPRGLPQPGERVSLFSGLGDGQGGRRELAGTVQTADGTGIWVLMDDTFEAGGMSGSPLLSQHTGQVVGMAIAVQPRAARLLIGFHPIGHLVALAEGAGVFPRIADYPN